MSAQEYKAPESVGRLEKRALVVGVLGVIVSVVGWITRPEDFFRSYLLAFLVAQRTHDIGIRLALGARSSDIVRLVVQHAMLLTSAGVAAGMAGSIALSGWMRSMLFGVGARDPVTLVATALLLVLVALLACWVPARRAARVDPMVALRCE